MSIIDKHQGMRACLSDVVDYVNGALQTALASKADASTVETIPDMEFGYETVDTIDANGVAMVTINFGTAKAEEPLVLTGVYQNGSNRLRSKVSYATTTVANVYVYNDSDTSASNVTLDWVAISGR